MYICMSEIQIMLSITFNNVTQFNKILLDVYFDKFTIDSIFLVILYTLGQWKTGLGGGSWRLHFFLIISSL